MRLNVAFLLVFVCLAQLTFAQCIEGDCINGWGIHKDEQGRKYEGFFQEGERFGKGKYIYSNGDIYDGLWKDGLPDGYGIRYMNAGTVKAGKWTKGELVEPNKNIRLAMECLSGNCQDGFGSSKDAKGRKYQGNFKEGKYNGLGVMTYEKGRTYKGNWQNGVPHGPGAFYYRNGHIDRGSWENGVFKNENMKVWAVIVGIGDYESFTDLAFTNADAQKVYQFFKSPEGGAVPESQVVFLQDSMATKLNIQNSMADLYEKADSNDLIMFYCAGHGKKGGFIPYDYDPQKNNLLYHNITNTFMMDSPAKYKLIIADACHSGSYMLSYHEYQELGYNIPPSMQRSTKSTRERIQAFYKSFENVKPGLAVMMSSASDEISLEASKLEQGVFSYFLILGLKGHADEDGNSIVTVKELYDFVSHNVGRYTYGYQSPVIDGNYDDRMTVGMVHKK
jgi:hypothetical protein